MLLDSPSDHEVEGALATECDVLYAMFANFELSGLTKHIRLGCARTLKQKRPYPYAAQFVHLAGHATDEGLWMLGEVVDWATVAKSLSGWFAPLKPGGERILNFSCCDSERAAKACATRLRPFFSGAYFFRERNIGFAKSCAAWTLFFYLQGQRQTQVHFQSARQVNQFLRAEELRYLPYHDSYVPIDHESIKLLESL